MTFIDKWFQDFLVEIFLRSRKTIIMGIISQKTICLCSSKGILVGNYHRQLLSLNLFRVVHVDIG